MTPLVYSPLAVSGFSIFRAAFLIVAYFLSSAYNPFHIPLKCISIPCRTCCRRNYCICIYVYNHIFSFSGSDHAFCCVADSPSFVMSRFPGFGFPLYEGLAVSLKCDVDSNPPSSPKWMKGDTYALYTLCFCVCMFSQYKYAFITAIAARDSPCLSSLTIPL
jgi:hypothetical protein